VAEGEVSNLASTPVLMSIRRLADEFGMARETVAKRLGHCNVPSAGERHGYPVYRLKDACTAILLGAGFDEGGVRDPSSLPPDQRNSWYQSEHRRVSLEAMQGRLIPVDQVEGDMATLAKDLVQFLGSLPDVLERDFALTPEQTSGMHDAIDKERDRLYRTMVAREPIGDAEADGGG